MTNEIWNFFEHQKLRRNFLLSEIEQSSVATLPVKRELNISIKMNVNIRPFLKQKQHTGVIFSIIKTIYMLYPLKTGLVFGYHNESSLHWSFSCFLCCFCSTGVNPQISMFIRDVSKNLSHVH